MGVIAIFVMGSIAAPGTLEQNAAVLYHRNTHQPTPSHVSQTFRAELADESV